MPVLPESRTAITTFATTAGAARRRLWDLPPQAHELLAAMAVPPELLRRCAEQALSRLHKAACVLQGSEADMLYAVVHDLGTRNAVSEAVQRLLERRHAALVQRALAQRQPEALNRWWLQLQGSGDEAGALWALLTHPQGGLLQDAVMYEARTWVFTQARRALADRARGERQAAVRQTLAADNAALQLRLQAQFALRDEERRAAEATIATLHGALARAQPAAPAPAAAEQRPSSPPLPRLKARADATLAPESPLPAAEPAPERVRGRRVLCVGGMPGAQARYRSIVETAGGHFAYHDGGIEQGVHRLDQQLAAADLVVCQAGCLNHEAYRRVKGHCRRLDKPCLFVERPSLAHFARTLGVAAAAAA